MKGQAVSSFIGIVDVLTASARDTVGAIGTEEFPWVRWRSRCTA